MKKETKSSPNNQAELELSRLRRVNTDTVVFDKTRRDCPECGMDSIKGMPGGRDATCTNCGYKDPCCYD